MGNKRRCRRERGATAVEFALAATLFLLFMMMMLEVARLIYLGCTVQEVTRRAARAAVVTDFSNAAAMATLRQRAMFRDSPGWLPLGGAINGAYLRIEYLSASMAGTLQQVTLSAGMTPRTNLAACINDPYGAGCIRFVRVRLCLPSTDGSCSPVPYEPLFMVFAVAGLRLPLSTVMMRAESLGYQPGLWP